MPGGVLTAIFLLSYGCEATKQSSRAIVGLSLMKVSLISKTYFVITVIIADSEQSKPVIESTHNMQFHNIMHDGRSMV